MAEIVKILEMLEESTQGRGLEFRAEVMRAVVAVLGGDAFTAVFIETFKDLGKDGKA